MNGAVELVDTHCHIQSAGLGEGERATRELWAKEPALDAEGLASDAARAGVTRLICVGCDYEDSRLATDFVRDREGCWASVGIHPHEARHYTADKLREFAALANRSKVVAIGECGLDYHYGHSPADAQREVLRFQIELALKHGLPVIFHVREAFDDFWAVFDDYDNVRGVLHSFTDSADNLRKALERGLYLGVNGISTFTKDTAQLDVYRSIPLEKLLLETDAPFLTPAPYRGNINKPKRVRTVAEFLSELRGEDREALARATTGNARQLFDI
jgi:TatD DNase family protein